MSDLEAAWRWREDRGVLEKLQAVRVFYGPGEGSGKLRNLAIDRFGSHFWITSWADDLSVMEVSVQEISDFLKRQGAHSAVILARPRKGLPQEPRQLFGESPRGRFEVREREARYWIQFLETRHPGLFLDHLPLRDWLRERARGWKVLNAFAYTGSLSVACGLGGADQVTTLDLSKPTVSWAEANWALNGLAAEKGKFLAGDVFEWFPRLKRTGELFDCVILDPPSFSHGKKGNFSTAKDLQKLHELAMDLLAPGGFLVTSINSEEISRDRYENEISQAARSRKMEFQILREIALPETFPTRLGAKGERYLKGWILRRSSGNGSSKVSNSPLMG